MKSRVIKVNIKKLFWLVISLILSFALIFGAIKLISFISLEKVNEIRLKELRDAKVPEYVISDIIDIHDYARTGAKLDGFNNIVVHYVGNPGTSAKNNRDYFNSKGTDVSSHFIIGLEGEIIQCLPLDEISAASNHRNHDTISIEVCHPDESGKFNETTYSSLIKLLNWLITNFDLESEDIIRHYDVTGKECPLYYVKNKSAWEALIQDVVLYRASDTEHSQIN